MTTTAKFCSDCAKKLRSAPVTALTEEQRIFLNAREFTIGPTPDYTKAPKGDDGTCSMCKDQTRVMYNLAWDQ